MDPDAGEDEDIGMEIDHNDGHPDEFSESSEDKDDYNIRKSDSLIVAATANKSDLGKNSLLISISPTNLFITENWLMLKSPSICGTLVKVLVVNRPLRFPEKLNNQNT